MVLEQFELDQKIPLISEEKENGLLQRLGFTDSMYKAFYTEIYK